MAIDPIPITQADLDAHSEQALIELVYVRTANEILGASMASLDTALNVTQSVLNILQALQNIKNYITVSSPGTFNFSYEDAGLPRNSNILLTVIFPTNIGPGLTPFDTFTLVVIDQVTISASLDEYANAYLSAASAYFGVPIEPVVNFPDNNSAAALSAFAALKNNLDSMITQLSAITPAANLNDPGTLLYQLKIVQSDMGSGNITSLKSWILDSYDNFDSGGSTDTGKFQSNLTTAVTAAQSLNDSQKEDVRRFLFIFQEYYQSASAVLAKITQIIEKMAQKISQ